MQKKKGSRVLPAVAAVSVLMLISVTCLILADLFLDRGNTVEIEIPEYRGMLESDIHETDNIEINKNYIFSDKAERGVVISQSKRGRVKTARGEKYSVTLNISLGRETHKLPDLRGLDLYEASAIVRGIGCTVRTQFSESDRRHDSVLFSIPEADNEMKAGEEVILYVAQRSTPSTVTVPDFYGCALNNLQSKVEESGLSLGKIEFIYGEDFLPNTVIYQSIGGGCLVSVGETVDFYVAKAPENEERG